MRNRILKNMQWEILICCIILLVIGGVALFSATHDTDYDELKKQITWIVISITIVIIVMSIDYNFIAKISSIFYIG